MKKQQVIDLLKNYRKGTYKKIEFGKTEIVKGKTLVKHTKCVGRFMITYTKMKTFTGDITKPHPLPWGEWDTQSELKGLFIDHKGKSYLRAYKSTNSRHKTITTYTLDGESVSREYLLENGYIKQSKPSDTFTISLDNIISIG